MPLELFRADRTGESGCIQKKVGAFRPDQAEKVGVFRAKKIKIGEL